MTIRPVGAQVWGACNVVAGCAVFFEGLAITLLSLKGTGWSIALTICFGVPMAGALLVISGVCLLVISPRTRIGALWLLALVAVIPLPFIISVLTDGLHLHGDWENLLLTVLFLLPGLMELLALIEILYLWHWCQVFELAEGDR